MEFPCNLCKYNCGLEKLQISRKLSGRRKVQSRERKRAHARIAGSYTYTHAARASMCVESRSRVWVLLLMSSTFLSLAIYSLFFSQRVGTGSRREREPLNLARESYTAGSRALQVRAAEPLRGTHLIHDLQRTHYMHTAHMRYADNKKATAMTRSRRPAII